MADDVILAVDKITKRYDEVTALKEFSLLLRKGELLGLLGPNGAGKTTLIAILSGTLTDFSGTVRFNGENLFANRSLKNRLGIVPQEMAFYDDLSAWDNLLFWGGLYDIPRQEIKKRARELLDLIGLEGRSKEPVKRFSGGMKRRLNIAIGLIHQPELLLLDEPTVGIDVQAKVNILEIIKNICRQGTTVIFTTHQLAEVEQICSRIAIMDQGVILAEGSLAELIRLVDERELISISGAFSAGQFSDAMSTVSHQGIEALSLADNCVELAVDNTDRIPAVIEKLFQKGVSVTDLKIKSPNLEAVFLKLTGRQLRD